MRVEFGFIFFVLILISYRIKTAVDVLKRIADNMEAKP